MRHICTNSNIIWIISELDDIICFKRKIIRGVVNTFNTKLCSKFLNLLCIFLTYLWFNYSNIKFDITLWSNTYKCKFK